MFTYAANISPVIAQYCRCRKASMRAKESLRQALDTFINVWLCNGNKRCVFICCPLESSKEAGVELDNSSIRCNSSSVTISLASPRGTDNVSWMKAYASAITVGVLGWDETIANIHTARHNLSGSRADDILLRCIPVTATRRPRPVQLTCLMTHYHAHVTYVLTPTSAQKRSASFYGGLFLWYISTDCMLCLLTERWDATNAI